MIQFLKQLILKQEPYERFNDEPKGNIFKKSTIPFNLPDTTFLIVADTHGMTHTVPWDEPELPNALLIIGDVFPNELSMIAKWAYLYQIPVLGICGNHNDKDDLKNADIMDIHGIAADVNDITIAGWAGSIRYKDDPRKIMMSPDESISFARRLPKADILLSHDGYYVGGKDYAHQGLSGISKYLRDNYVPLHFYGHTHEPISTVLPVGTRSFCVYRFTKVDIKGDKITLKQL